MNRGRGLRGQMRTAHNDDVSNPDPRAGLPTRRRTPLAKLPRLYRSDGSAIRILLVDDEEVLTNLVSLALSYEGWHVQVAHTGTHALDMFVSDPPDAMILDIMLPDVDGLSVLERVRQLGHETPILFLTARDSMDDRLLGLTSGGDDYMTKPFNLEELIARLRGLLRRVTQSAPLHTSRLEVGDLVLDEASYEVKRGDSPVKLTTTEFELLRFFMRNPRRVLTRSQILDAVWNYDFAGRASIVDLYVSYLRKKIDTVGDPMIHTVRGVGYVLRSPE